MNKKTLPSHIEEELQRMYVLPPNDLGDKRLTWMYKFATGPLKKMPFIYILPLSFVVAVGLYLLLGPLVIKLVSILQYGF